MRSKSLLIFGSIVIGIVIGLLVSSWLFGVSSTSHQDSYRSDTIDIISVGNNELQEVNTLRRKQFDSYESFVSFIRANSASSGPGSGFGARGFGNDVLALSGAVPSASASESGSVGSDFSGTNVQVAGVDEADIVKTDGDYIYTVSDNKVVITEADSSGSLNIVSIIDFRDNQELNELAKVDTSVIAPIPDSRNTVNTIFVNGETLIVLYNSYSYSPYSQIRCLGRDYCGGSYESYSGVNIYDMSDRSNPVLTQSIKSDGNYVNGRMIDDYIYVVTNKYVDTNNPVLPLYTIDGILRETSIDELYYIGGRDSSYSFTSVAAIDITSGELSTQSYMIPASGTIYMSQDHLYLTSTQYRDYYTYQEAIVREAVLPLLPEEVQSEVTSALSDSESQYNVFDTVGSIVEAYYVSLDSDSARMFNHSLVTSITNYKKATEKEATTTLIHKIAIDGSDLSFIASNTVPGTIHDQFSMDEHDSYFRIATTTGGSWFFGGRSTTLNHVFVLDSDLNVVGSVEDLAEDERIFSSRFIGDRLYLVTFRQIDPFYVIDLSIPTNPEVLGFLKIPGVSDYLHPYDEDHVIGIGRDSDDEGRVEGLKISLFDVSDVTNPKEKAKFTVGERGSYSEAINDHKAVLFSKNRNLLALPITAYGEGYSNPISGLYVLYIDDSDITLRGIIEHDDSGERYYYGSNIRRSLYIDDILYAVSELQITAHDFDSLNRVGSAEIPYEEPDYNFGYPRGSGEFVGFEESETDVVFPS